MPPSAQHCAPGAGSLTQRNGCSPLKSQGDSQRASLGPSSLSGACPLLPEPTCTADLHSPLRRDGAGCERLPPLWQHRRSLGLAQCRCSWRAGKRLSPCGPHPSIAARTLGASLPIGEVETLPSAGPLAPVWFSGNVDESITLPLRPSLCPPSALRRGSQGAGALDLAHPRPGRQQGDC